MNNAEIVIVGTGAAGLMAAITAARRYSPGAVVALDGAVRLGAKILVAGGGRCNVTHDIVDEHAYAGSTPAAIRKVLRRFDVPQTIAFFRELGVELKREETGKLFPTTDSARTVLDALVTAARTAGVMLRHPCRVTSIERTGDGFRLGCDGGALHAARLILATGGKSLPKSGSDGSGYSFARVLGHSLTPRIFPALVPLTLPRDYFLCLLSGLSHDVTLSVHLGSGKQVVAFNGALLCTHFGVSGPVVLDASRYYLNAQADDSGATLRVNWVALSEAEVDGALLGLGSAPPLRLLRDRMPERLARALCAQAGVDPAAPGHQLTREQRRTLARSLAAMPLPITGHRGWQAAEVTAGGVPLSELNLATLESRVCPGLHLCGEICDVDGRIGGYNFQWAWASGYVAGASI